MTSGDSTEAKPAPAQAPAGDPFAVSTRWNAHRHLEGEAVVDEILGAGFARIELGYNLTANLVPGVRSRVQSGAVKITSVHNFCPVPLGAAGGHPELFLLADLREKARQMAVQYTTRTIEFAAEMGAPCVVVHAGRVDMRQYTPKLIELHEAGLYQERKYERVKMKLLAKREKKAPRHVESLCRSLMELLPALEQHRVCLAIENLPSWEAVPSEPEMAQILLRFPTPSIAVWYDTGHGQVRENLGFISQRHWVSRFMPRLAGFHIHDVAAPASDHLMPPAGSIDFSLFKDAVVGRHLVLEPLAHIKGRLQGDGVSAGRFHRR